MAYSAKPGRPAITSMGWQDKTCIIWMDTLYDTGLGAHDFIGVLAVGKLMIFSWQTMVPDLNINSKQLILVNQFCRVCERQHAAQLERVNWKALPSRMNDL